MGLLPASNPASRWRGHSPRVRRPILIGRPMIKSLYTPSGAIAQLGERIVRNDEVVGSIPTSSTNPSTTCVIGDPADEVSGGIATHSSFVVGLQELYTQPPQLWIPIVELASLMQNIVRAYPQLSGPPT